MRRRRYRQVGFRTPHTPNGASIWASANLAIVTGFAIWRDGGDENEYPIPVEKTGQMGNSSDIFITVCFGESEIAVYVLVEVLRKENIGNRSEHSQCHNNRSRKRTLSGSDETSKRDRQSSMITRI